MLAHFLSMIIVSKAKKKISKLIQIDNDESAYLNLRKTTS